MPFPRWFCCTGGFAHFGGRRRPSRGRQTPGVVSCLFQPRTHYCLCTFEGCRLSRKPCCKFVPPAQEPWRSESAIGIKSPDLRLSYQVKMRSFWQIFSSLLFMSKCVSGWLLEGNTSDLIWGGGTLMFDSSLAATHPSHKCERGFSG